MPLPSSSSTTVQESIKKEKIDTSFDNVTPCAASAPHSHHKRTLPDMPEDPNSAGVEDEVDRLEETTTEQITHGQIPLLPELAELDSDSE